MASPAQPANRLVHESSPYLKQHAHNPVDWYPWGTEALERARALDRPIFLSIGYSACHWCHVMEHESFEDAEVARILNESFVSIKVDREERPDLDQVYMTAVQLMTGQGGWPMSVFLTPQLRPFYGGTYFPPDERYGRPSFKRVLLSVVEAWRTRRSDIAQSSEELTRHVQLAGRVERDDTALSADLIQWAVAALGRAFDPMFGGFGAAPKFPHATELRLLLRAWKRFGADDALQMARRTLDAMAQGGIYDQLGGGFHRYSTDERWLVPHFEKMLYDNALLSTAYLEAYQATREPRYREIVDQTLEYVRREMTSPEGAFYSAQDADSEGEEGKFFVWSLEEIERILGQERADLFADAYGASAGGNWEGVNILHRARTDAQLARLRGADEAQLRLSIDEARQQLFRARAQRVAPARDDKILTAWNGMMIGALAQAARVLGNPQHADAAARAGDFLLSRMRSPDGRLLRAAGADSKPKLNAYLDDHAFLIDALVSLYEATFAPRWLDAALALSDVMIDQFWDPSDGGFFYTARDHEQLIARTKDPHDGSTPSGNAMAATGLLRLAKLTGRRGLLEKAEATLRIFAGLMRHAPAAAGQMLIALDFYLGPTLEFAIVGESKADDTRRSLEEIYRRFLPNKVVAFRSASDGETAQALLPLLENKTARTGTTIYICRDFACEAPLSGALELARALDAH
jgi:uncharacterized protein YyaL (SSP411 family)